MRYLLAIAVLFLAGVCALHLMPRLPNPGWASLLLLSMSVSLRDRRVLWLVVPSAGFLWAWWQAELWLADELDPALEGHDLRVVGVVASVPDHGSRPVRFVVAVEEAETIVPRRLRLSWYAEAAPPEAGERWQLVVRLRQPRGFSNPGGFDYRRHLLTLGIGAVGYVRESSDTRRLGDAGGPHAGLLRLRAAVAAKLARLAPDSAMLGIVTGLAVGVRDRIPSEQWDVFVATGTGHLMAISGLHVGLVAGLFFWIARGLAGLAPHWLGRQSAIDVALAVALTAASGYAALAGFSLPTRRALVMLGIILLAVRWRRHAAVGRGLSLALVAVLLHDPLAPLSPGFWLSFAAVAVIVCATAGRIDRLSRLGRFWRLQWLIFAGLTPASLVLFGQLALLAPLANLLLIPLFSLAVIPLVLVGVSCLLAAPPVGEWLIGLALRLLETIWPWLAALAEQPIANWHASLPILIVMPLLVGVALVLAPSGMPGRPLALLFIAPALLWRPEAVQPGELKLTVLDVGQGLAAVVRTAEHVLVFDAGPSFPGGADAGRLVVAPYLWSLGLARIDMLIISHGDSDHAGGGGAIRNRFQPSRLLSGPTVERAQGSPCTRGQRWEWDGVWFEMLHPPAGADWSGNNASCVLRITGTGGRILLPADIEASAESQLLAAAEDLAAEVVIVPHHGSRTSSTPAFVAAVGPQHAIVSAGYRNRWRFPKVDVVARWRERGALVWNTATSGAITVRVGVNGALHVEAYRDNRRRYWFSED